MWPKERIQQSQALRGASNMFEKMPSPRVVQSSFFATPSHTSCWHPTNQGWLQRWWMLTPKQLNALWPIEIIVSSTKLCQDRSRGSYELNVCSLVPFTACSYSKPWKSWKEWIIQVRSRSTSSWWSFWSHQFCSCRAWAPAASGQKALGATHHTPKLIFTLTINSYGTWLDNEKSSLAFGKHFP